MPSLFDPLGPTSRAPDVSAALDSFGTEREVDRGAVFTRPEVAATILDLCGYTADRALHRLRLSEPSFGGGDFLLAVRVCCSAGVARAARRPRRSLICTKPCTPWGCVSDAALRPYHARGLARIEPPCVAQRFVRSLA